ncbi:DUF397 domain-containing protein [Actinoallomurus purpureus]
MRDISSATWRKSLHSGAAQNCVEVAVVTYSSTRDNDANEQ